MNSIETKLASLKLQLPKITTPLANYLPCTITGSSVFVSGQLPQSDGKVHFVGKLGEGITEQEGMEAAQLCMLNILAQLQAALGSLEKVKRCLKITGFVNATADFIAHPKIVNGASDLIVALFGDAGKHARAAVGVSSLPLGAAVEVEAIFEIES